MMKRFRKIYVEITNICNMHCSFCPETSRAKAFMPKDKFEHIAKEIVKYTDYVYLHVKGEPLIHKELEDILNICNKYGLKINISTNGTMLETKKDIIKSANIRQLNLSLHSFEKDENTSEEELERLNKYIENVVSISNELARHGTIIRYKLWNQTKSSNKEILEYLESVYDVNLVNEPYERDKKLRDNVFLSIKTPFEWPDLKKEKENEKGTCYGLKAQIAILVDGTVVPCCVDNNGDIPLGNIFNDSLENILNSKRAQDIIQGFKDNKCVEELCKKCEYRDSI